jgi:hypothetical protein
MNADYDLAVDPKRLRPNLRDVWLERLVVTGSELAPAHPGRTSPRPDFSFGVAAALI